MDGNRTEFIFYRYKPQSEHMDFRDGENSTADFHTKHVQCNQVNLMCSSAFYHPRPVGAVLFAPIKKIQCNSLISSVWTFRTTPDWVCQQIPSVKHKLIIGNYRYTQTPDTDTLLSDKQTSGCIVL